VDPLVADGDPCCDTPDTWSEVVHAAWAMVGVAAVTGLVLCAAIALLVLALTDRLPPWRRVVILEAGCIVLAAGLVVALALPNRGKAHARIDCRRFAFDRAAWAGGGVRHDDVARGLDRCRVLDGRSTAQVLALLGPPDGSAPAVSGEYWRYRGLDVYLRGPRVDHAAATGLPG
jgi:hypothetical protein